MKRPFKNKIVFFLMLILVTSNSIDLSFGQVINCSEELTKLKKMTFEEIMEEKSILYTISTSNSISSICRRLNKEYLLYNDFLKAFRQFIKETSYNKENNYFDNSVYKLFDVFQKKYTTNKAERLFFISSDVINSPNVNIRKYTLEELFDLYTKIFDALEINCDDLLTKLQKTKINEVMFDMNKLTLTASSSSSFIASKICYKFNDKYSLYYSFKNIYIKYIRYITEKKNKKNYDIIAFFEFYKESFNKKKEIDIVNETIKYIHTNEYTYYTIEDVYLYFKNIFDKLD